MCSPGRVSARRVRAAKREAELGQMPAGGTWHDALSRVVIRRKGRTRICTVGRETPSRLVAAGG